MNTSFVLGFDQEVTRRKAYISHLYTDYCHLLPSSSLIPVLYTLLLPRKGVLPLRFHDVSLRLDPSEVVCYGGKDGTGARAQKLPHLLN